MLLYVGSLVVLTVYSILYGLTAEEERWLGATTSVAVIILGLFLFCPIVLILLYRYSKLLQGYHKNQYTESKFLSMDISTDWNMGACLYGFKLLQSSVAALFVAGTSRVFLICFGVHYWFVITF